VPLILLSIYMKTGLGLSFLTSNLNITAKMLKQLE